MGREMADEFCLKMPDFHVTFRDLLHAVNLRHGTNGFTSLSREGLLRIFFRLEKIRRLRTGLNPRIWVPKANTEAAKHYLGHSRVLKLMMETEQVSQMFVSNQTSMLLIVPEVFSVFVMFCGFYYMCWVANTGLLSRSSCSLVSR